MRVAALYDIHGNLPALEAVLQDIRQANVGQIVVGGDVVPGPMPRETLTRLLDLDLPTHFIYGNGELAILAQIAGARTGSVTYWGTTSGARPPANIVEIYRWTAAQLQPEFEPVLARWPKTLQLDIDGLGQVLFCHSTPRSETEVFTRLTAEDRLLPLFEPLQVAVVVCGHTHMQFDRMIGRTRVVNAGSLGCRLESQVRIGCYLDPTFNFAIHPTISRKLPSAFERRTIRRLKNSQHVTFCNPHRRKRCSKDLPRWN